MAVKCRIQPLSCLFVSVLADAWESCKDADVLLESPSAMAGVHIAEALGKHVRFALKRSLLNLSRHPLFSILYNALDEVGPLVT